jgi:hypothetical protein
VLRKLPPGTAAITKRERDRIGRLSRHDPGRTREAARPDRDLDQIPIAEMQSLGERGADRDRVSPGELGQRLW